VQGFAGLRFEGNQLAFDPYLPQQWSGYSFKINYQNRPLSITVTPGEFVLKQLSGDPMVVKVGRKNFPLSPSQAVLAPTRRSDA
jgi:maltose phosphorylase